MSTLNSVLTTVRGGRRRPADPRDIHLWITLPVMLLFVCFAPAFNALSLAQQLTAIMAPVAILGVAHGGADPWVGHRLLRAHGVERPRRLFFFAYLCCAGMVLAAWLAVPLLTLSAFLVFSIFHFGEQDALTFGLPRRTLDEVVFGSLPVLGPIAAHPDQVAVIFSWLTEIDPVVLGRTLAWLTQPLACLWLIGIGMVVGRVAIEQGAQRARRIALAVAVLALVATTLPPLIAFAVYFCLLHSFGHVLEMATTRRGPWNHWTVGGWSWRLVPATAGAILLAWLGGELVGRFASGVDPSVTTARMLFWGLAALTVPHVLLHDAWRRSSESGGYNS